MLSNSLLPSNAGTSNLFKISWLLDLVSAIIALCRFRCLRRRRMKHTPIINIRPKATTPPIVPPTIIPTLKCGAEGEADVELGLPRVEVMAEVDNEDKAFDEDKGMDEDEAVTYVVDEVPDGEDARKPIGS